ncbi:MAG: hypothetical protein N2556_02185, partial [Anaerolineae bacterium]|nr:hypothetical protein [Anaerolineae bacterium]
FKPGRERPGSNAKPFGLFSAPERTKHVTGWWFLAPEGGFATEPGGLPPGKYEIYNTKIQVVKAIATNRTNFHENGHDLQD